MRLSTTLLTSYRRIACPSFSHWLLINKTFFMVALFLALGAGSVSAANNIVITSNTDWSTITTGSGPGGLPNNTDNIEVRNGKTLTVDVTDAACASLQLGGITGNYAGTLTFSGTNPKLTVSGLVQVGGSGGGVYRTGTITFTSGATLQAVSVSVGGTGSATLCTGTITMIAGGTLITGSLAVNPVAGNTWTPGTGTVILNATNTLPSTLFTTFHNLSTSTTGTTTTSAALTIGGNLNIGDGTTFNAAFYGNLHVTGSTTIGGGTSGIFITAYNPSLILTGLVTINSGGTWDNSANSPVTFQGGITNNGTFTSGSAYNYTFDTNAQSLNGNIDMSGSDVSITGITLTNNGTFTNNTQIDGTGTFVNSASGTTNIGGNCQLKVSNLTNNGALTMSGGGQLLNSGTFINQGTTSISGTFYSNPGVLNNQGTLTTTASNGFGTSVANFTNTGTINLNGTAYITGITNNAGGTVNFINAAQRIATFDNATSTSVLNISALITSAYAINPLIATTPGNTVNYNGVGAQAVQAVQNNTYSNLIIAGGGTKTLGGPTTVTGTLTLTNGILNTTTNLLSVTNTATSAISGGSTTAFINGPLAWTLPANLATGSTYNFPVGAGTTYLPFSLVNPTTSGTATAQVQAFNTSSGGSADGTTLSSISTNEYWSLATTGNFTNSSVSLTRPSAISPLNTIGGSTTVNGTYSDLGGTAGTDGVTGSSLVGTDRFFVLAQKALPPFWYKADSPTQFNGTTWTDQTANGNNATVLTSGTGTITYADNTINFNPSLAFSNVYQQMVTTNSANVKSFVIVTLPNISTSTTLHLGGLIGASSDNGIRVGATTSPYNWNGDANGNDWVYGSNGTSWINGTSGTSSFTGWHIVTQTRSTALNSQFYLGGYAFNRAYYGNIAEVMAFSGAVPNQNSVETYLAVKYGITLTGHDYIAGDGSTNVYAISGYANNIAGLGNDATYGLNQKVSTSINFPSGSTSSQIVMATTNDFTSSNLSGSRTGLTNGQYLIWGDNAGSTTSWTTSGPYKIVARTWKVQNTGSVGSISFQIDLTGYPAAASGSYALLVNSSPTFSSGGATVYSLTHTSGNLYTTTVTFPAGTSYFTVSQITSFWYKADAGTSTTTNGSGVLTWNDQSGAANNATSTTGQSTSPTYQSIGSNFNPTINYPTTTGSAYFLTATNNIFNDMTFFAVYNSTQNVSSANFYQCPAIIGGETSGVQYDYTLATNSGKLFFKGTYGDNFGAQTTGTYNNGIPQIVAVTRQQLSSGAINLYVNGVLAANAPSDNNALNNPTQLGIGNNFSPQTTAQFVGNISEVYGTNAVLSPIALQHFESYLALKYGVTLAQNYTNGSGTTVCSISGYANNIAGLGNDVTYGLNQKVSASINLPSGTSSRIVMATTNDFTSSNLATGRTGLTNGQYLIWGDNNGTTNTFSTPSGGVFSIVKRIWKVQNTGNVGTVYFQIDLSSYPATGSGSYALLVSSSSAFGSGSTAYPLTKTSGTLYTTNLTFPAGTAYFTISYIPGVYVRQSPNGNDAYNGTTWSNAYATIDKGVSIANSLSPKLPVFVAAGTYTPTATNVLNSNIKIYGGFAGTPGTEITSPSDMTTKLNSRNLKYNASFLTGTTAPIVSYSGTVTGAMLDGFVITGATSGSGYAVNFPAGADTIQNCKIKINTGVTGALSLDTSNVATNILVSDNSGIGINFAGTSAKVVNATIANNTGVGINSSSSTPTVTNSILWGNSANVSGTVPTITYTASAAPSTYASATTYPPPHNSWWSNAGNVELYHRSPNFKNPNNNYKPNRNYELLLISPCLGNGSASANPLAIDANGKPRTYNSTIDMGAFEKWDGMTVQPGTPSTLKNVRGGYTIPLSNLALSNDTMEVMVPATTNFNMGGNTTPFRTKWLELMQDTIGPSQLTNGIITADSVLYVRRFSKTLNNGTSTTKGVWSFFGVPFTTAPLSTLDGAVDENTVRIEGYSENARAVNGVGYAWYGGRLGTSSTMTAGTGYALSFNNKVPQNDIGQTVIFSSPSQFTFTETGTPTQNVTLTETPSGNPTPHWYDCGWNLIANPLPQTAGVNNTWGSTSYYGAAYFYKQYTDSYNVVPASALKTGTGNEVAPNGAFFIQTDLNPDVAIFTAGTGTGTVLQSMAYVRPSSSAAAAAPVTPATFQFHVTGAGDYCNTYVIFDPRAHVVMEPMEDNPTMVGVSAQPALQLSTTATGSTTELAINRLPFNDSTKEVPMQLYAPTAGSYTITMLQSDTIASTVLLQDASGNLHDLTTGGYTFTTTADGVTNNYTLIFGSTSTGTQVVKGITILQDHRNVTITADSTLNQVALYGIGGQMYYMQNPDATQLTLQLPSTPGVYLLKIITPQGVITKKMISRE